MGACGGKLIVNEEEVTQQHAYPSIPNKIPTKQQPRVINTGGRGLVSSNPRKQSTASLPPIQASLPKMDFNYDSSNNVFIESRTVIEPIASSRRASCPSFHDVPSSRRASVDSTGRASNENSPTPNKHEDLLAENSSSPTISSATSSVASPLPSTQQTSGPVHVLPQRRQSVPLNSIISNSHKDSHVPAVAPAAMARMQKLQVLASSSAYSNRVQRMGKSASQPDLSHVLSFMHLAAPSHNNNNRRDSQSAQLQHHHSVSQPNMTCPVSVQVPEVENSVMRSTVAPAKYSAPVVEYVDDMSYASEKNKKVTSSSRTTSQPIPRNSQPAQARSQPMPTRSLRPAPPGGVNTATLRLARA